MSLAKSSRVLRIPVFLQMLQMVASDELSPCRFTFVYHCCCHHIFTLLLPISFSRPQAICKKRPAKKYSTSVLSVIRDMFFGHFTGYSTEKIEEKMQP